MSKGAYIGVNGVARKIKRGYIGVDGVARKIIKAYIGVGGVARPFWNGGTLTYYGKATDLSGKRYYHAATAIGDYALIGGGQTTSGRWSSVEVYDSGPIKGNDLTLNSARSDLAATSTNEYAIFAGGSDSVNVDAFAAVTFAKHTNTTFLKKGRSGLGGATAGNKAIFAGGVDSSNQPLNSVDAYNSDMTKVENIADLGDKMSEMCGVSFGGYALFAGNMGVGKYVSTVYAYNADLTRKCTDYPFTIARMAVDAATVGDYVIFAGGFPASGNTTMDIECYNKNLTKVGITSAHYMNNARHFMGATSVEDFAIFAGGYNRYNYESFNTVDIYDSGLTHSVAKDGLSKARYRAVGVTVGNKALITGGTVNAEQGTVDVYTVI